MRAAYLAISLVAIVAGAGAIRANVIDDPASGPSFKATRGDGATPAVAPIGRRKALQNSIRLAQGATTPQVTNLTWQQTTGNPTVAPFKWAGFLNNATQDKANPKGWGCTAQFITANVLLTAGHCVLDLGDGPNNTPPDPTKITFLLQYQNGQASQTFKTICARANPLWNLPATFSSESVVQQNVDFWNAVQHDFAMVLVDGTSPVGFMSYDLDWKGKYESAWRIGYPGGILDADIIQRAPGILFFGDTLPFVQAFSRGGPTELPNAVVQWGPVTDATHGMSGGAWVANFDEGGAAGKNTLIAVTSSGPQLGATEIPVFPGGTWAAYLTAAEFNPLLASVSAGCK